MIKFGIYYYSLLNAYFIYVNETTYVDIPSSFNVQTNEKINEKFEKMNIQEIIQHVFRLSTLELCFDGYVGKLNAKNIEKLKKSLDRYFLKY